MRTEATLEGSVMRIESVRIENFRGIKDQVVLLNGYTCLVGPNGSGKSTILSALNVFFQNAADNTTDVGKLAQDDFHRLNTADPVRITVTFTDLSEAAKTELSDYVRLDRLVVSAEARWNAEAASAEVLQYGQRSGMEAFRDYFGKEAANAPVPELRLLFQGLRGNHEGLRDARTKADMADALREYEASRPEACTLIPSNDQFYGIGGKGKLSNHVQWVYLPAVKDPASEQAEAPKSALAQLLKRAVEAKAGAKAEIVALRKRVQEDYGKILATNAVGLDALSESLTKRIQEWAHEDARLTVQWRSDMDASVKLADPQAEITAGDGYFDGQLARFGHGLQRSFLIALLQELAAADDPAAPTLILACEEPEIYQHPPQARHLGAVFQRLSQGNAQVVLCTHSPYFVQGRGFEDIRLVRRRPGAMDVTVASVTYDQVSSRIAAATGKPALKATGARAKLEASLRPERAEIFFAQAVVVVEGAEDAAYVTSQLVLDDHWDRLRARGVHIVAMGGKSEMPQPIAVLKCLGVPVFVVCDSDCDADKPEHIVLQREQNVAVLGLCGADVADQLPAATRWEPDMVMCAPSLPACVKAEVGAEAWQEASEEVRRTNGLDVKGMAKNPLFVGLVLDQVAAKGRNSSTLKRIAEEIGKFGDRSKPGDLPDGTGTTSAAPGN
jgi:putative ATP-dependent endonuclease of OLD family